MEENTEKIEKHWVIFPNNDLAYNFGQIVKERQGGVVDIIYSEGQKYSPECWDPDYVERFSSPQEAIDTFLEKGYISLFLRDPNRSPTKKDITEYFLKMFPSQAEKANPGQFGKDWVMDASGKPVRKEREQTQPSCTEKWDGMVVHGPKSTGTL